MIAPEAFRQISTAIRSSLCAGARLSLALVLALGAERPARADPAEAARLVPADVSIFVSIDHPRRLRHQPVGQLALALIDGVAGYTNTFTSWDRLAADLGLSPARAFDELLGERVVFAARQPPQPPRPDPAPAEPGLHVGVHTGPIGPWLLASDISKDAARRLANRLRPMPRQIIAGTPLLSIEDGRFQLALVPHRAQDTFILLLAESARAELLEAAVRDAATPKDALDSDPAWPEIRNALTPDADAIVFARFDPSLSEPKATPPTLRGWVAVALASEGNAIKVRTISTGVEKGVLPDPRRSRSTPLNPWNAEAFEHIAGRAVFASVESNTSLADEGWSPIFAPLADKIGLGKTVTGIELLTGRIATLILPSETGVCDAAIALETTDATALAPHADSMMARLLALAAAGAASNDAGLPSPPPTAEQFDFHGEQPAAVRSVDASRLLGDTISSAWKTPPDLNWRYSSTAGDGAQRFGWWTIGLGDAAAEALSNAELAKQHAMPPIPWMSMVSARPALALELLTRAGVPIPRPLEPLSRVSRFTWYSLIGPGDRFLGGGRIDLQEPPASR